MVSTPLLQNTTFGPDEIAVLVVAFEGALRQMNLIDRADPATEMVARIHRQSVKRGALSVPAFRRRGKHHDPLGSCNLAGRDRVRGAGGRRIRADACCNSADRYGTCHGKTRSDDSGQTDP